jgi:hypothetical protein
MMEKKLKNLKHELDPYISEQNIFTEISKRKIRVKILEAKFQKKKQSNWMPILASGVAVCLFVLLLATFVGDNNDSVPQQSLGSETNSKHSPDSQNGGTIEVKPTRPLLDPEKLTVGEKITYQLVVKSVSGTMEDKQEDPLRTFRMTTDGELTLEGSFQMLPHANEISKVVFLPDEISLLRIPVFIGYEAEPYILIVSPNPDLIKYLGLEPGKGKQGKVTVNHYSFYEDLQAGQNFHRANLLTVDGQVVPDGFDSVEVTKNYSLLKEDLIPLYKDLVSSWDDHKLKGLEPIDVFQLYWQAFEYGNLELRYFLLGGEYLPEYMVYTEKFVEKHLASEQALLEKIKQAGNLKVTVEGNSAFVIIDEATGEKVEMIKNELGVWKVKFIQ